MQQLHKGPMSEFAIASLTLAILCFVPFGGFEKAVAAIAFGILALKKIAAPDDNSRGEGLAAAGIVLGIVYVIIVVIAIFVLLKNPEFLEQMQMLKRPLTQ